MIENRVRMSIVGVIVAGALRRALRPALVPPGRARRASTPRRRRATRCGRSTSRRSAAGSSTRRAGRSSTTASRTSSRSTASCPRAAQTMVVNRLAELLETPASDHPQEARRPARLALHAGAGRGRRLRTRTLAYVSEHREDFPGVRAEPLAIRRYIERPGRGPRARVRRRDQRAELTAQPPSGHYELGDTIGKAGVELTYESDLRGKPGTDDVEVDAAGRSCARSRTRRPQPGNDVQLDLDLDVQKLAEDSLTAGDRLRPEHAGQELQEGVQDSWPPRPGPSSCSTRRTVRSWRWRRTRPTTRTTSSNGIPTPTWQWLNDPAAPLPAGQSRDRRSVRAGFDLQADHCDRRPEERCHHGEQDDRRQGQVRLSHRPEAVLHQRQRAQYTAGSTWRRRSPSRATCTSTRSVATSTTARSTTSRMPTRCRTPRASSGSARSRASGSPNEASGRVPDAAWKAEGPRRRTRPRSRSRTGCRATTSGQAVGQSDLVVTPLQLANAYADVRERRHAARAATGRRGPRREWQEDPRPRADHAIKDRGTGDRADDARRDSPAWPRIRRATAYRRVRRVPARTWSAGKTGTAQVQDKQSTSLFVGMTPALNPQVHRARDGRGRRLRRRDRRRRSSAGSCRASTTCRSPTSSPFRPPNGN